MQKSSALSFAVAVIFLFLVFLFMTTYYFVGTVRREPVNETQCNCQHLNGGTVPVENRGTEVAQGDLKFTVSFFNNLKIDYKKEIIQIPFCSGVLLNPTMVLTSYHCFDPNIRPKDSKDGEDLAVVGLGHDLEKLLTTESGYRKVKKVHFNGKASYPEDDLAIVQVDEPFDLNSDVSSACLIDRKIDLDNAGYIASGFTFEKRMLELTENKTYFKKLAKDEWQFYIREGGCKLQVMRVNETDPKQCTTSDSKSLICVSSRNASTCLGDTGLAIVYEFENNVYVAGISGGLKDKEQNCSYGQFASVYSHRNWIEKITGGNICPPPPARITGGFNEFVKRIGIAYFVCSAILLVLLTSLLRRKGLDRKTNKPSTAETPNEPRPEDGQTETKNVGGSVAQKAFEEPKKVDESAKKVDEIVKNNLSDASEGSNKPDDDKSENSLRP